MKELRSTDWARIEHRYEASKEVLDYMSRHQLSYSEAVAQVQRLHYQAMQQIKTEKA